MIRPRPMALFSLPLAALAACAEGPFGMKIVPPEPPPRSPLVIDTTGLPPPPFIDETHRETLLDGDPRTSAALVDVVGEVEPHLHRSSDEILVVLEGGGDLLVGQSWRPIGPGAFVRIPAGLPHAFVNRSASGTRAISIHVPPLRPLDRVPVPVEDGGRGP